MGVYRERVDGPDEELSLKATVEIGRKMLSLGFYLTVRVSLRMPSHM